MQMQLWEEQWRSLKNKPSEIMQWIINLITIFVEVEGLLHALPKKQRNGHQHEEYHDTKCYRTEAPLKYVWTRRLSNASKCASTRPFQLIRWRGSAKPESSLWQAQERCQPDEREDGMDVSSNYTFGRLVNDPLFGEDNFPLEHEWEWRPQRSVNVFNMIGPDMPRNRPQQPLPMARHYK